MKLLLRWRIGEWMNSDGSSIAVRITKPEDDFLPVWKHERLHETHRVAVARGVSLHRVLRADFERARAGAREPALTQRCDGGRLERPLRRLAVGSCHVQVQHRMRVDEF